MKTSVLPFLSKPTTKKENVYIGNHIFVQATHMFVEILLKESSYCITEYSYFPFVYFPEFKFTKAREIFMFYDATK